MKDLDKMLSECLYFTANKLSRAISKIAEEEFKITGLSPSYAYTVNIVNQRDGITQKELGEMLHITPSTITRFIDKLESKKLVRRSAKGKVSYIHSTEKGKELQAVIDQAWDNMYEKYSEIIGKKEGDRLTIYLDEIGNKLEKGL